MILMSCVILILRLMGQFSDEGTIAVADSTSPPPPVVELPLSTRGATIIDREGKPVQLRGVNWFGLETANHAPHGLWARDYKAMLGQIHELGYNTIRLPYSIEGLRDGKVVGIDFRIGDNQELFNKSPIEVMDAIITEAGKQGLMILLDSHQLSTKRIPPLWYGDGFTEWDWIRTWAMLAERYKNQPNVIGADLKNEPHGVATWGTNDRRTDWRLAAERAGNAILNINPNWLIVVEGVEENVPGQKLPKHWMGGNLEGVKRFPVRLKQPRQLVYSPHEYGPGVFPHKWFDAPEFPENLLARWQTGFFYIVQEQIAPIYIGEFGGKQVDQTSKEGIWQNQLVDFIKQHQLSYTYWSWNPNSGDTGGLLSDDWMTVIPEKQMMLKRILPQLMIAAQSGKIDAQPVNQWLRPRFHSSKKTAAKAPRPQQSAQQPAKAPVNSQSVSSKPATKPQQTGPAIDALSPSASKSPAPVKSPVATVSDLVVKTSLQSDWDTGFCTAIQVVNPTDQVIANWKLRFDMPGASIDQSWNGQHRQGKNGQHEIQPPDWGKSVQAKQAIDMGFCAKKTGKRPLPRNFQVIARKG
ncbi:cellulase family glycosylhydrolase [filamentous cyanobacterium LEGE 11480]|uniref:Endoglucanase n=2 Tax=Romeriopsis TaxID=2992131 RepID=A0A928VM92_9CYAN|nr:cellulase family glycosylhydrolase [Romeriopsis navalis LEGE 11480]